MHLIKILCFRKLKKNSLTKQFFSKIIQTLVNYFSFFIIFEILRNSSLINVCLSVLFTALGLFKSLLPAFFVLTSSGRFEIGTSQNLASCSTMADFYNTNTSITVLLNSLGLVRSHDCHKSHRSKMVAII